LGGGGERGEEEIPLRNTNLVIALFDWPITKNNISKGQKNTPQFSPIKRRKKPMLQKKTSIL
jgi:hypothetical protein